MSCAGTVIEGCLEYFQGAELGDAEITWLDNDAIIDFSGSWAWEAKIGPDGKPAVVTKTTGITGAAAAPNVTIVWDPGELDALEPGRWTIKVRARRLDTKDRIMQAPFVGVWLADEANRTLHMQASSDPAAGGEGVTDLAFGEGAVGWVAAERRPLEIDDIFADGRFVALEWARARGLRVRGAGLMLGVEFGSHGFLLGSPLPLIHFHAQRF